jgi:hypothetical protein
MKKTYVIWVREGLGNSISHTLARIGAKVKEIGGGVILISKVHPCFEERVVNFLQGVQNLLGK